MFYTFCEIITLPFNVTNTLFLVAVYFNFFQTDIDVLFSKGIAFVTGMVLYRQDGILVFTMKHLQFLYFFGITLCIAPFWHCLFMCFYMHFWKKMVFVCWRNTNDGWHHCKLSGISLLSFRSEIFAYSCRIRQSLLTLLRAFVIYYYSMKADVARRPVLLYALKTKRCIYDWWVSLNHCFP